MNWIAPAMSGLSAVLSLIAVFLVSRLDSRSEHRKWKRDAQMEAAIELKLAVARLRVKFSHPSEDLSSGRLADGTFDFSEVNAAMARVDLVGSGSVTDAVKSLRVQLREFVKSSNSMDAGWRHKRAAIDATVDEIVDLIRKEIS